MSSIIVLPQRDAVYMMTDAAVYTRDGTLRGVNVTKGIALPTLHCVVSATGPAEFSALFAHRLAQEFSCLDEIVEHADRLSEIMEDMAAVTRGGDALTSLYLAGWLSKQDRPAAFAVDMWTDTSSRVDQVAANSQNVIGRGKLIEQKHLAGTPLPSAAYAAARGFRVYDDANRYNAEIDLHHMIEIQRHEQIEDAHWIGGKAVLSRVDASGISQRVVAHWEEDRVGEPIAPILIQDWKAWRQRLETAAVADAIPEGLSRLQRERMLKKARKGTLRS